MGKYVFAYHGGRVPETPEEQQQVMGAWMEWFGKLGSSLVDPGQPIGRARTFSAGGQISDGGGANPVSGWSIVAADSLDHAVRLAKECPVLQGGASIEVAEAMDIPGM
jgi:hypothetical protein